MAVPAQGGKHCFAATWEPRPGGFGKLETSI